jgi:chromosome segregation ATPase
MGIKIINSREYREKCEEIAFLQAEVTEKEHQLKEKERELELKNDDIIALKRQIATLTDTVESMTSQLKDNADLLAEKDREIARLNEPKAAKPDVIDFTENAEEAKEEEASKPKPSKKPKKSGK